MVKDILREKILNTLKDFNSEWNSVEDFRNFAKEFIHLRKALYDGWYCINRNEGLSPHKFTPVPGVHKAFAAERKNRAR